jgi:hypothetical protein
MSKLFDECGTNKDFMTSWQCTVVCVHYIWVLYRVVFDVQRVNTFAYNLAYESFSSEETIEYLFHQQQQYSSLIFQQENILNHLLNDKRDHWIGCWLKTSWTIKTSLSWIYA